MPPFAWNKLIANTTPLHADGAGKSTMVFDEIGVLSNATLPATVFAQGGVHFALLGETGVAVIEPRLFGDHRGFFLESYHAEKYAAAGITLPFVQDNHSRSTAGVLRGLHYQIGRPQGKLVRAIRGAIFDVSVDLRKSSTTFGHWFGTILSAENRRMLYIPPGFAHGFCTRDDETEVLYKCTDLYAPTEERTLLWNDPTLNIPWPVAAPILAEKDRAGKALSEADTFE